MKRVCLLPGDGIGPEVTAEARRVLDAVVDLEYDEHHVGAAAIERHGVPLVPATLAACRSSDAVLLGAVGDSRWDAGEPALRPEQALFSLRSELGVYANLRPVRTRAALQDLGPLVPARLAGVRFLIVRELTGGLYYGARGRTKEEAFDTCRYSRDEIRRIARTAFSLADARVTSVDKFNVLDTSRLWRETVSELHAAEFPHLELDHVLVDTAAMQLVANPRRFEVVLTENLFGDILSDLAAALAGSIGLLPSASLADDGPGLFEPVHGSAPDIAGLGVANPLGTILCGAMMLRHGLGLVAEADLIERAVDEALAAGVRTRDLGGTASTRQATDQVLRRVEQLQVTP